MSDVAEGDKRHHGYSRDKRPDCPQVVIALVVTPEGLPLAYEYWLATPTIAKRCGCSWTRLRSTCRARRVWVMDRASPSNSVLAEMRASDPPVQYLAGTPKGRLSFGKQLRTSLHKAREGVAVKLLANDGVNFTSSLKVTIASQRNVRCAGS